MDRTHKQAILIMIQGIEAQLLAMKSMLSLGEVSGHEIKETGKPGALPYTTEEEDKMLAEAMQMPEDGKDVFMQDVFKLAQETSETNGDKFQ